MTRNELLTRIIVRIIDLAAVVVAVLVLLNHEAVGDGVGQALRGALGAGVGVQQQAPQSPVVEVEQARPACWVEYHPDGAAEPMSGDLVAMPMGSDPIPCSALAPTPGGQEGETPLGDAEWSCFTLLGYDTSTGVVYPRGDDLATCRAMAVYAVRNDCWLEDVADAGPPEWVWLSRWTVDGLCPADRVNLRG
jgi:hypothetical protein